MCKRSRTDVSTHSIDASLLLLWRVTKSDVSTDRFEDFDIDDKGCLGRREFTKLLGLSLTGESRGVERQLPDFPLGGLVSKAEAEELMDRLDRRHDGTVYWKVRCQVWILLRLL